MRNQYRAIQEEIYEGMQMAAGGEGEEGGEAEEAPVGDKDAEGQEQKDPKTDEEE